MRRINEAFLEPRHEFIMDGTSIETPPPPREFHADLNEGRDEREFKTRDSQTRRAAADQKLTFFCRAQLRNSPPAPLLFKTFTGFQAFCRGWRERAEFHRFFGTMFENRLKRFPPRRASACAKSDDAYQRFINA